MIWPVVKTKRCERGEAERESLFLSLSKYSYRLAANNCNFKSAAVRRRAVWSLFYLQFLEGDQVAKGIGVDRVDLVVLKISRTDQIHKSASIVYTKLSTFQARSLALSDCR